MSVKPLTYQQFLSQANGTVVRNYGFDQCVALTNQYHIGVLKGQFIPVNSAYQLWTNNYSQVNAIYTKSSRPVAGAVFVSQGGIYDRTHGHTGIVTRITPMGLMETMEQNAGTWRYLGRYTRGMAGMLGFLIPKNNPAGKQDLAAYQRQVANNPVKRRAQPTSKSVEKQPPLAAHTVGDFNGWIRGEQVNDGVKNTNIWYRGSFSGDWFWAGGFTSQSTTGLADLNPAVTPKPSANQRQVDPTPANVRNGTTTGSKIVSTLASNAIITPEGWLKGQSVQGIDIWYKVSGGYAWAGGFTVENTSGLTDLTPKNIPEKPVDPPLPVDPTGPNKDVGPGPVLSKISDWDSASGPEFGSTNMIRPTPSSVNLNFPRAIFESTHRPVGGFYEGREGAPNHFVIHHGMSMHRDGLINSLNGPSAPTTNFVAADNELVAMVDTRDTAATNGRYKSNLYGINYEMKNHETNSGKPSTETHETVAWSMAREALRWNYLLPLKVGVNVFGHKDVSKSPTSCPGDVDIKWITDRANEIIEASQNELPTPQPDYSGLEDKIGTLQNTLDTLIDMLKKIFKIGN